MASLLVLLTTHLWYFLVCEVTMADSVENFVEVSITSIHCSPLIHQASYLRTEGYEFG